MKKIKILLILFACISLNASGAPGINIDDSVDMDPALYQYYKKCNRELRNPKVLRMLDTLYTRAGKLDDRRTQAAALCQKAMHYYYTNGNHDSLRMHTLAVQKFAKETGQSRYYYWIWMRYADDYIRRYQYNLALLELQAMRKEATESHDYEGIADSYKAMARLYHTKGNHAMGSDLMKKAIELIESGKVDGYNRSNTYLRMANFLIEDGKPEEGRKWIEKARHYLRSDAHKVTYYNLLCRYGSATGNRKIMTDAIAELEKIDDRRKDDTMDRNLYSLAMLDKNYAKALLINDTMIGKGIVDEKEHLLNRARIYARMPGRERESIESYERYVTLADSIDRLESKGSLEEFTTILNLSKANIEKKDMEIKLTNDKYKAMMICLLGCAVLVAIMFVIMFRTRVRFGSGREDKKKIANFAE